MVIGEQVTLEEMGGARMHTSKSGVGHALVATDEEGIEFARRYLGYMPTNFEHAPPADAAQVAPASTDSIADLIPLDENKPFDMHDVLDALLDADSFLEIHARWAKELIVGYGRLDGQAVGHRRQPAEGQGRRAVRRLLRQGGALHPDLQRVQRAAAVPRRRARAS